MSEEWPDDDPRFTGPDCPLDKTGGVASGEALKPKRVVRKRFAVCEIVRSTVLQQTGGLLSVSARVMETAGRIRIIEEHDKEVWADRAAKERAEEIAGTVEPSCTRVVAVIPIWRVEG